MRHVLALREGLPALHLVGQLRLDDLDGHHLWRDPEVVDQRLGDVAHHVLLLLIRTTLGHKDVYFRHPRSLHSFTATWQPTCPDVQTPVPHLSGAASRSAPR